MELLNGINQFHGADKYVFISYSHDDQDRVLPIIDEMEQRWVRLWFDKKIPVASYWHKMCASVKEFKKINEKKRSNLYEKIKRTNYSRHFLSFLIYLNSFVFLALYLLMIVSRF